MTERERELTAALQGLLREFPTRTDLQDAGWDVSDIDKALNAKAAADIALKSRYCQEPECAYYGHKSPATCDCHKVKA